jgi:hypothetical protein
VGKLAGAGIEPVDKIGFYPPNKSRDELDPAGRTTDALIDDVFNLSAVIPASANSVRLRISGTGISQTEFFTPREVIFSTAAPTTDTDGDGVADNTELVQGSNPNDKAPVFKITGMNVSPYDVGFTTVSDHRYQAYLSTDLCHWAKDGISFLGRGRRHPDRC